MSTFKLLDVGCGPGLYVDALRGLGVDAMGIDADEMTPTDRPYIKRISIFAENFLSLYQHQFDLVMSLEVAEHLPSHLAWNFVERLVACLKPNGMQRILFSAAHPGQGGDGHINCQPKQYWLDLFSYLGFELNVALTNDFVNFMQSGYHMGWLRLNAMILTPKSSSFGSRQFDAIAKEEAPQATRIAEYFAKQMSASSVALGAQSASRVSH
jgi:cyclopropane fatty-acyl-phospholipid synthase-like methyltransferase